MCLTSETQRKILKLEKSNWAFAPIYTLVVGALLLTAILPNNCYKQLKFKIMYFLQHYVIDWDKVKTQEDLITILKN